MPGLVQRYSDYKRSNLICRTSVDRCFFCCFFKYRFYFVISWYTTQFGLFAIQDFDSRWILYLNRHVIVFNVNMYVYIMCPDSSNDIVITSGQTQYAELLWIGFFLFFLNIGFILWYTTQFGLFAIQDFDSRWIQYLNRHVIVFNVNMYVEVLQLLSGLQYSCHIQGDISVDARIYSFAQRLF